MRRHPVRASRVVRVVRRLRFTVCVCGGALALAGCAATSVRTAGAHTALQVQAAADSALASYEALRAVAADSAYNQGYLRVVVAPQPDAVDFTAVADAGMASLLEVRQRACRQLKTAAEQFRLVCGAHARAEAVQAYAASVEALRGFSGDTTPNTEFKRLAAALPGDLTAVWQTRRVAQARGALAAAAAELAMLWAKERGTWEAYVDDAYITGYAAGLLSLRLGSFDEKELAKQVSEPYGIAVKAGLFKMKKYYDAVRAAEKVKAALRTTSEVFEQVAGPAAKAGGKE